MDFKEFKQNRLSIISKETGEPISRPTLAKLLNLSNPKRNGYNYVRLLETEGDKGAVASGILTAYFKLLIKCIGKGGFKEYEEFKLNEN